MSELDNQLASATDAVLAVAVKRVRKMVQALSMADLADLRIADSGSDRVLDRNFERTQSARNTLAKIEAEIARRAQLTAAPASTARDPSAFAGASKGQGSDHD